MVAQLAAQPLNNLAMFPGVDPGKYQAAQEEGAQPVVSTELADYLLQLSQQFSDIANPRMLIKRRTWLKVDLYWKGEQQLEWDPTMGSYKNIDPLDRDLHFTANFLNQVVETMVTEYTKSQPQFTSFSEAGDDQRIKDAVDVHQFLSDCIASSDSFSSKRDRQQEAHLVLMRSGVFTRVYVDKAAGPKKKIPQYGISLKTVMPGKFSCPHCGSQGALHYSSPPPRPGQDPNVIPAMPQPPQTCPDCDNGPISIDQRPIFAQTLTQTGIKEIPLGEIKKGIIDPLMVDIADDATGPWDSPFLRYDNPDYRWKLKKKYPNWSWNSQDGRGNGSEDCNRISPDKMIGLLYMKQIECSVNNLGVPDDNMNWAMGQPYGAGLPSATVSDSLRGLETILYYRDYVIAERTFTQPTWIPGLNKAVPAGTRLGDVFPNGVMVTYVDGECVDMRNKCIDDEWGFFSANIPTRGAYGTGIEQIVAVQDWLNEWISVSYAAGMMGAWGLLFADADRFDEFDNRPGHVNNILDRTPGEPIENNIFHLQTTGNNQNNAAMVEDAQKKMIGISGARASEGEGVPGGPGMETATGQNYQNAIANAVAGVKLELKAENDARCRKQAVKAFRETQVFPRYMRTMDKAKGRWLSGLDVDHDISVKVEEDTHQPQTMFERRGNLVAARTQLQYGMKGPDGKPTNPQWFEAAIPKLFGIPEDPDANDKWNTVAYRRIDAMVDACQGALAAAQQQGLPQQQAEAFAMARIIMAGLERGDMDLFGPDGQPNPEAMEPSRLDDDNQLIMAYMAYGLTDEFRQAHPLVRKAIENLLLVHTHGQARDDATKAAIQKSVTQQILAPLMPPPPVPPPSVSIAFKDMPPSGQIQAAAQHQIKLNPQDVGMGGATPDLNTEQMQEQQAHESEGAHKAGQLSIEQQKVNQQAEAEKTRQLEAKKAAKKPQAK